MDQEEKELNQGQQRDVFVMSLHWSFISIITYQCEDPVMLKRSVKFSGAKELPQTPKDRSSEPSHCIPPSSRIQTGVLVW